MNRVNNSNAIARGVTSGYAAPSPQKNRRRMRRPKRKRGYPGFRIRMMDIYVDAIRAVARCTGWTVSHFVYYALLRAMDKSAAEIGMAPFDIAKLSSRQRAEIRRKYRLAMTCMRELQPELN